jgi:DHA2 family multidrug resistance protein
LSASAGGAAEPRITLRQWIVVFAMMLATLLEIIDSSIVNVSLPAMRGNLGATIDEIGWVVTGYIMSNVVIIPISGWLSSYFGRRRYVVASILIFTGASFLCGVSTTLPELVAFRVLQGLGGGALMVTSQTVLVETFPASRQGTAQAIFGMGAMLGPSLGPTLGGWITDNYSWPWIFHVNVPLGLLAALLCSLYLAEPPYERPRQGRFDGLGFALLAVGLGSLQFVLERGERLDWFESQLIVSLALTAALTLVAFVWRQLVIPDPIVHFSVLRHRSLQVGCLFSVGLGAALFGSIFLFPLFTQTVLGWTAWRSGLGNLPASFATMASMFVAGRIVQRTGPKLLVTIGLTLFTAAAIFSSHWTHEAGWWDLFWPMVVRGFAMGFLFVPMSMIALRSLPPAELPQGSGLFNLFRHLGASVCIAALATLLGQWSDVHRVQIDERVGELDRPALERLEQVEAMMLGRGLDPETARELAVRVIDGTLESQAWMLSFRDGYTLLAVIAALYFPLIPLMRRSYVPTG